MINSALTAFWKEEDGQDLVEYSLLLAFIALSAIALLSGIKPKLSTLWGMINTQLTNATSAAAS
jgi:Flp pilus assembly pilin Flp